jgi:hypothetical protein
MMRSSVSVKRSLEGAVPARFSISSVEVAASLQERVFLALAEEAAPPALHCYEGEGL